MKTIRVACYVCGQLVDAPDTTDTRLADAAYEFICQECDDAIQNVEELLDFLDRGGHHDEILPVL